MSILRRISVIALCASFFYGANGQSCELLWDDGTVLSETDWRFGFAVDSILDVTPPGTVLLNMTANNINQISSSTPSSVSNLVFMEPALLNGRFTLTLTESFTQYEELETSTTMRVSVIFECTVDSRKVDITQPITDTNNNYPEFQNAPYIYKLPIPFPSGFSIQLFGTISARDIDLTNTMINFNLNSSDPNSKGFSASWLSQDTTDTKLHYAQLLSTALLSIEDDVTFDLFATDNGDPALTSVTTITITVDAENSTPVDPVFAYPVYIADHSGLTIEEASGTLVAFNQGNVRLNRGADSTVEYTINHNIADYASNFGLTVSGDFSYVSITMQNVTEELLAEKYVILTLTATRSGAANSGVTILHIDLPGINDCISTTESITTVEPTTQSITTDSESTITTESYTECPIATTEECICDYTTSVTDDGTTTGTDDSVTTTTTSIAPSLSFSSSIYRFDKESTFTGILMTQRAEATNTEGTIVYSVSIDDDDLASRIIIDPNTAALEVTAAISPGVYTFKIIATIEESNLSASATVVLVISSLTECSGEVGFGYALQIIELYEESPHENILPLDDNGCEYSIYSQTPSQDLFFINGTHLNTVAIDREAAYFSEMSVAQVRVIVDVSCPNETEAGTKTSRSKRGLDHDVLTENIAYDRTRTVLVVIIKDINDNPPVWKSDIPTYVGFPGSELSRLIHVPYVDQFSATDADIGENAIVTYNLPSGSDEVFHIHNTEGTLYIQKGASVEDGYQFKIIATDGLFETPRDLTVRSLESSNVVVLFITGATLEDVQDVIEELSSSTGYWISSLVSAVISEKDISSSRSLRSASRVANGTSDANTLLRLVIYGIRNTVPVSSETLVSDIEGAELTWAISDSATLQSILENSETGAIAEDSPGYLAAIIVLSVLLLLISISGLVMYYLFYRRRNPPTSVESNVTYETFDNRSSNGSTGKDSVTLDELQERATESTDSPNPDWTSNQTKKTEKSFFGSNVTLNPLKEDKDGDFVFINRNESVTAENSPKPARKKSVAFKPTVEEIEVSRL